MENKTGLDVEYNERGQMTYLNRASKDTSYSYFGASDNFRLQRADTANINDFTYTYDDVGNILSISNSVSNFTDNQTFTYDHLNRLETAQATGGTTSDNYYHTSSNDYDYDALGNIIEMGGSGTDYLYTSWHSSCPSGQKNHAHAMPHAVKKRGSDYFCYDANGNMTRRKQGSDLYVQAFDVENRLTSVTLGSDITTFEYDASGQRTLTEKPDGTLLYTPFPGYEKEIVPAASPPQITSFTVDGQSSVSVQEGNSFQLAWNSVNTTGCTASGSWSGSKAVSGTNYLTAPAYNTNGKGNTKVYSLTCHNGAGQTSATHQVTVTVTPCWINCGGNTLLPTDEKLVRNHLNRRNMGRLGNGGSSRLYQGGGGSVTIERTTLSVAGQSIAVHVKKSNEGGAGNIHYLFSDHLGSSSVVTDANGNYSSDDRALYTPFGELRGNAPAFLGDETNNGYTGHEENRELGLTYMRARYYIPSLGRFASADTIVPDPTNPQAFNRFSYVENRPLNLIDPTGHCGADASPHDNDECESIANQIEEQYSVNAMWDPEQSSTWWTLADMLLLLEALNQISDTLGGSEYVRNEFSGTEVWMIESPLLLDQDGKLAPLFDYGVTTNVDLETTTGIEIKAGSIVFNKVGFQTFNTASKLWAIIHEFGHVLDRNHDFAGTKWMLERVDGAPISDYDGQVPSERFAQAFALTVFQGDINELDIYFQPREDEYFNSLYRRQMHLFFTDRNIGDWEIYE